MYIYDVHRFPFVSSSLFIQARHCVELRAPGRGLFPDGHFVSGVTRGFSRCHFDYISGSVAVAVVASRAAAPRTD